MKKNMLNINNKQLIKDINTLIIINQKIKNQKNVKCKNLKRKKIKLNKD